MRASLKLGVIVLVLVLCGLLARTGPVRDVMLGVHVLWVTAYGSPADVARLIDDADQAMAEPNNNDELYACGVTWRVTLAELRASGASDEEALQGASAAVAAQRGGTTAGASAGAPQPAPGHDLMAKGDLEPHPAASEDEPALPREPVVH